MYYTVIKHSRDWFENTGEMYKPFTAARVFYISLVFWHNIIHGLGFLICKLMSQWYGSIWNYVVFHVDSISKFYIPNFGGWSVASLSLNLIAWCSYECTFIMHVPSHCSAVSPRNAIPVKAPHYTLTIESPVA